MTEMICIVCPRGCRLSVDEENGFAVTGNGCEKGIEYGRQELTAPTRTLTSTVRIEGAALRRCPVRTSAPIPKARMFEAMELINSITVTAPVKSGQVLAANILGTGAHLIATRDVD